MVWMKSLPLLLCIGVLPSSARKWQDLQTVHAPIPRDIVRSLHFESDPFSPTLPPTLSPTGQGSNTPTPPTPTVSPPSLDPTRRPTIGTASPTRVDDPTTANPTRSPTHGPTVEAFPDNDTPMNPPRGYFNYDTSESALYGPGTPMLVFENDDFVIRYQNNGWEYVLPSDDYYWDEFGANGHGPWNGILEGRNMDENMCGSGARQSPIDIRLSGVACVEHHQIRTRPGDFRVAGDSVEKRIESNKLRLVYQRRPCPDLFDTVCAEPDPPAADFPNGWGGFADTMHVDFKLPSEHRIYGEIFDAEMQIFHLHPGRRRLPAISVLIRADPNGYNYYLQTAIDAFQYEYNLHMAQCSNRVRKGRKLVSQFHSELVGMGMNVNTTSAEYYESWGDFSTHLDDPDFIEEGKEHERRMQATIWFPHHQALIPTYWFYGYDGSLTEPPCTEIVSWFVMDTPMIISPAQLEQMKTILFTHVDSNCQGTSVHYQESVARPIQESANRQVWRCTRDDFPPDAEREN